MLWQNYYICSTKVNKHTNKHIMATATYRWLRYLSRLRRAGIVPTRKSAMQRYAERLDFLPPLLFEPRPLIVQAPSRRCVTYACHIVIRYIKLLHSIGYEVRLTEPTPSAKADCDLCPLRQDILELAERARRWMPQGESKQPDRSIYNSLPDSD